MVKDSMEAQLNLLLIDTLLKAYGAPKLSELLRRLSQLEEEVDVHIVLGDNKASTLMEEVLRAITSLSDKVRLETRRGAEFKYAPPRISIGGRAAHRVAFHGLIDGILLCPLVESILYAGGALPLPELDVETGEHSIVVYVVPGRPCLVTLRNLVPLVIALEKLKLDVIDAREYERRGGRIPSPYVPAVVVDGKLVKVGSVKNIREALRLITS